MALSFPASPTVGATSTQNSRQYVWTGYAWELVPIGSDSRWDLFLPPAPTSVTATGGDTQAVVTWTAPTVLTQTPITNYTVQYSSNSGSSWATVSRSASTATSVTVTGLTNGTSYTFRVSATNGVGTGSFSTASNAVTAGSDPYFSSVALLLHFDGNGSVVTDSSGSPKTVTVFNATQSATQSQFGGKSLALNGSSDYISIPSLAFASGDWALECWLYFNALGGLYTGVYDNRQGSNGAQPTLILSGSNICWYTNGGFRITGSALNTGQWYHVAVARASGSTRMWVDGSQVGSTYSDSTNYDSPASPVIGKLSDGYFMNGFMDDLRITVGSSRGYSSASITRPTLAFQDR